MTTRLGWSTSHSAVVFGIALALASCGREPDSRATDETTPPPRQPDDRSTSSRAEPEGTEVADRLREVLAVGSPRQKVGAAHQIAATREIPAPQRTALLVTALRREVEESTPEGAPSETYLSTSDWIRAQFTRALGTLASEAGGEIQGTAALESGEVRDRLILAQGHGGDRGAAPELRRVLLESPHGDVRTHAAYLLGELADTSAIPDLTRALDDPHLVSYEDLGHTISYYGVRAAAATALEKLGVPVVQRDDGTYEVRPPNSANP